MTKQAVWDTLDVIGRYEMVDRVKLKAGCEPSTQVVDTLVEYLIDLGRPVVNVATDADLDA